MPCQHWCYSWLTCCYLTSMWTPCYVCDILFFSLRSWLLQVLCNCYFSAYDCYELGRLAYLESDYYHTVLWMIEALNRLEDNDQFHAVILDYLAYATYMVCFALKFNLSSTWISKCYCTRTSVVIEIVIFLGVIMRNILNDLYCF